MKPDNDIRPPFSKEDIDRIREILKEADIKPEDHFHIPRKPGKNLPGEKQDPTVPQGRIKEDYNGQKGDGAFKEDRWGWQPGCGEPFVIKITEAWTPPPAGLANKFDLWAAFATVRAILICLQNTKCRRVHPLGCSWAWEQKFPNGTIGAGAEFVFECIEQ
jgi:hypothetical protein